MFQKITQMWQKIINGPLLFYNCINYYWGYINSELKIEKRDPKIKKCRNPGSGRYADLWYAVYASIRGALRVPGSPAKIFRCLSFCESMGAVRAQLFFSGCGGIFRVRVSRRPSIFLLDPLKSAPNWYQFNQRQKLK